MENNNKILNDFYTEFLTKQYLSRLYILVQICQKDINCEFEVSVCLVLFLLEKFINKKDVSLIIVFLITDSPKRCWPLHWASMVCSTVGVVLVLVARGHYTVDVIIAYYATTRVFWLYHTMANHAILKVITILMPICSII